MTQLETQEFLPEFPANAQEIYDIVLVTGDAYVDHPSFGAALIGRHLESLGYRVGIIAQPDWKSADDFRRFGKPRLFFGVTAGNVDSMVANYTPDRRKREADSYSPGGKGGLRPDLATVVYGARCREAYPDAVVVLGGVEASLRRLAHYDYVQQKVRGSVLADAKADLLVYGMGERQAAAIAGGLAGGLTVDELKNIPGTAYLAEAPPVGEQVVMLPSAEEAAADTEKFHEAHSLTMKALLEAEPPILVQPHNTRFVVVNPPAAPLEPGELDALYRLPFARAASARHDEVGGVPALAPVRYSVVTHRGCYGGCSFCALTAHQGKAVVSRPLEGVVEEIKALSKRPDFDGTIRDIGGPTANMYGTWCRKAGPGKTGCSRPSCLYPEVCAHLETSGAEFLKLLRLVRHIQGVKHAYVASGVRHDLLIQPPQRRLFRELVTYHVGGQMKVAPEHVSTRALGLMNKPANHTYRDFVRLFKTIKAEVERDVHVVPYLMAGHPGTTLDDAIDLARFVKKLGHYVEQVQTFTPTPMTASTCMYVTKRDPMSGERVYVPTGTESANQRALAQFMDHRNRARLVNFLKSAGRQKVVDELYGPPPAGKNAPRGKGPSKVAFKGGARKKRPQ